MTTGHSNFHMQMFSVTSNKVGTCESYNSVKSFTEAVIGCILWNRGGYEFHFFSRQTILRAYYTCS